VRLRRLSSDATQRCRRYKVSCAAGGSKRPVAAASCHILTSHECRQARASSLSVPSEAVPPPAAELSPRAHLCARPLSWHAVASAMCPPLSASLRTGITRWGPSALIAPNRTGQRPAGALPRPSGPTSLVIQRGLRGGLHGERQRRRKWRRRQVRRTLVMRTLTPLALGCKHGGRGWAIVGLGGTVTMANAGTVLVSWRWTCGSWRWQTCSL
jgi:hypothetical protein